LYDYYAGGMEYTGKRDEVKKGECAMSEVQVVGTEEKEVINVTYIFLDDATLPEVTELHLV
jgi:hypothetical protein